MCSIAGIITKKAPLGDSHTKEMQGLLNAMHHRGPDSCGMHPCSPHLLLGSNRLRITDSRNPAADMPLHSSETGFTIVFNGEIYNHRPLREELKNFPFRTKSDSETLLAAYAQWGSGCLSKIEGMYAFAIHDSKTDGLFIACDPTGQKTVYIYEDAQGFVFASEIEPLIANPFRQLDLNVDALGEFVAHRFILGEETHIKNIRNISPGTWMHISNGSAGRGTFYSIPLTRQTEHNLPQVTGELRRDIETACAKTFDLEVPYGLLLSGGIDSTAVLAAGRRLGLPFKTFSVGFDGLSTQVSTLNSIFNEFTHSRALAAQYGTDHTEIVLKEKDYCAYLDKWTEICGEPLGSQEAPCLVKLFEAAAGRVRVMFSGSGPDEIFDGYAYGQRLQDCPKDQLPEIYFDTFKWAGDTNMERLMPSLDTKGRTADKYRALTAPYMALNPDPLQWVQLLHFHGRLAAYEFRQMDTISMWHSIEARSPLIDTAIVNRAFSHDPSLKAWKGVEKFVYKESLRGLVPDSIIDRKKQGFPIPGEIWFSQEFTDRAAILFDNNTIITNQGPVDKKTLREIWTDPRPAVRNLFSRLYTLEAILRRQAPQMHQSLNHGG